MKKLILSLAAIMISTSAVARTKPFNISVTPDLAVFNRNETIEGLTLSIWGENQQTSLALGIVNGTVGNSAGVSLGLFLNYADNYKGIQWAPINYTKGDFLGWQSGFINYSGKSMRGLQIGAVNYTGALTGLQLGVVNFAETADTGLQIGLVNVISQNRHWFSGLPEELAPAMIFVNWRF